MIGIAVQEARVQLIAGINLAQTMLAGGMLSGNDYGQTQKLQQIGQALGMLRKIGFGSDISSLQGTGLHASASEWIQKHGINENPLAPKAVVKGDSIDFGEGRLMVSFQRTVRLPDDGRTYDLPAGLGVFPLKEISRYQGKVPQAWLDRGGVLLPMYRREAMWMNFSGNPENSIALKVGAGLVNALSGEEWRDDLNKTRGAKDYLVAPGRQRWLDGWNGGVRDGVAVVRQFVAEEMGQGATVEQAITGKEERGGIQLLARGMTAYKTVQSLEDEIGRLVDRLKRAPTERPPVFRGGGPDFYSLRGGGSEVFRGGDFSLFDGMMGLAQGAFIKQQIFDDADPQAWDLDPQQTGRIWINLVSASVWREITGEEPPRCPVTKREYERLGGAKWFDYYAENAPAVNRPTALASAPGIAAHDAAQGIQSDAAAPISTAGTVVTIPASPSPLPTAKIPGAADEGKGPWGKG